MLPFNPKFIRHLEAWVSQSIAWIFKWHRRSPQNQKFKKILIVKSCCMGDAILSLYAIREFKHQNPESKIDAFVSSRIEAVYRHSGAFETVYSFPVTGFKLGRELARPKLWLQLLKLLLVLYRHRFDMLIDMELYRGYGVALARVLGVTLSRGFEVPGAPTKSHDLLVHRGREEPEWQCFYKVMGLSVPTSPPLPLYPVLAQKKPGPQQLRIGFVFGSSANWPQKKWPLEHFATLGRALKNQGMQITLYGAINEIEDGTKLHHELPTAKNTVGQLNYEELLKSVSCCDLVVGNDTGTLHLASAAGIPVITLFGPTSPNKWNALTSRALYLENLTCRPCYYLGSMPKCSHLSCLRLLDPETVLAGILTTLKHSERMAAA